MRIIEANATHLDDLVWLNSAVQRLHVEKEPHCFRPFDETAVREAMESALSDSAVTILLAVDDDEKALGYVLLRLQTREGNAYALPRNFLELDQIAVAPEARRQGIGAALVDEAFNLAKSLGDGNLELSVWHFNEDAQSLFRRKGFEPCWQRMRTRFPG